MSNVHLNTGGATRLTLPTGLIETIEFHAEGESVLLGFDCRIKVALPGTGTPLDSGDDKQLLSLLWSVDVMQFCIGDWEILPPSSSVPLALFLDFPLFYIQWFRGVYLELANLRDFPVELEIGIKRKSVADFHKSLEKPPPTPSVQLSDSGSWALGVIQREFSLTKEEALQESLMFTMKNVHLLKGAKKHNDLLKQQAKKKEAIRALMTGQGEEGKK